MGRTVRIKVTAEDIEKGERNRCEACPIALAIKRVTSGEKVRVGDMWITFAGGVDVKTPSAACDFVHAFDEGKPVEPFTFYLELP